MAYDSIPHRIQKQAATRPTAPAYYERIGGQWKPTDWRTYGAQVRQCAQALVALGVPAGGTVAILGFNRPEWTIMACGAMSIRAAAAGIYTTNSPEEVQYITDHAEASVILLEDVGQWKKVEQVRDELPHLKHVVMMRGTDIADEMVMTWEAFLARADDVDESAVDERMAAIAPDDLASLIYTSGTTGPPKGVMLTHENCAWTANCALDITSAVPDDTALSYLPLSHIAEQMFTVHVPATVGYSVHYAESIENVAENLKEVQPTIFFGVPRIWEKFHAGITSKLAQATGTKKKLVDWAMGVGDDATAAQKRGETPSGMLGLQYKLAGKLIFSKLKPAVGLGRARICVSGAAPIAREVIEFFASLDIRILEVYGQSEDSGPTSFNRPGVTRIGSVGPALPGVEVKIADDGEILVKGPNVFKGYYKEPEATAETLVDGWLHSGDLGRFDDDGFLFITGRKKEIIITAGGKNIAPKNIEAALKNSSLINEAVVIGDRRKFLSALVTLDPEGSEAFAKEHGLDVASLYETPQLRDAIQQHIDAEVNPKFAKVEQVKKFTVLHRNLTIEDGELTPTLKVKRRKVNDNFAAEIEAMYADA